MMNFCLRGEPFVSLLNIGIYKGGVRHKVVPCMVRMTYHRLVCVRMVQGLVRLARERRYHGDHTIWGAVFEQSESTAYTLQSGAHGVFTIAP
jgi:hypothetical protein